MASVGPSHYVVAVLHIGDSKASNIKLVLQREPRTRTTWISAGSILPNEEHVNAAIRELHEETGLILTYDELTMLNDAPVRVVLPEGQRRLVYVFSAYVPVPYMTTHLRTSAHLKQAVIAQSTINANGSYVVPATIDIDGLSLKSAKNHGLLPALKHKYELLHFGYVTQWETFCRSIYTHQVLCYDDTSIPRQFFLYPRFTSVDSSHVWMLIRGYIDHLCGVIPNDLRMGAHVHATSFARLLVTLTETQRKAAINSKFQSGREMREPEDWLKAQPQRFVLLGITADSYDAMIWVTSQFSGPLKMWWLNRKQHAAIPATFDLLVEDLR
jgi:ADP-ribose pyrophosphatase YjhB (NUDIX family)